MWGEGQILGSDQPEGSFSGGNPQLCILPLTVHDNNTLILKPKAGCKLFI